jgi:hypothetical protein
MCSWIFMVVTLPGARSCGCGPVDGSFVQSKYYSWTDKGYPSECCLFGIK